jgi:phytoene dehydrogenase-like protein
VLGPLLARVPPKVGSKRPGDLLDLGQLGWRLRGVDVATAGDLTRLFTSSIADLVDDHFESAQLKGVLSVSGVIGTWAGPRSPGTGYVMVHHKLGDVGDGSRLGAWGFPEGGMGAVTGALHAAARRFGAEVRVGTPVERILVDHGRASGVALRSGEELHAPVVVATTHPRVTFLDQLDRDELPEDFVTAIERWKSRSGTVKVNVALDRLPTSPATRAVARRLRRHHRARALPRPRGTGVPRRGGWTARQQALRRHLHPERVRPDAGPEGHHVMSMFTQWVPTGWSAEPHRDELDDYADRVIAQLEEVAPGFTAPSSTGR